MEAGALPVSDCQQLAQPVPIGRWLDSPTVGDAGLPDHPQALAPTCTKAGTAPVKLRDDICPQLGKSFLFALLGISYPPGHTI